LLHPQILSLEAVPFKGGRSRVIDGTDHNSVSGPEEFWEALVEGKRAASPFHHPLTR
jgi:hypothetical protein